MDAVLGMIGLAKRAGKVSTGLDVAESDIRKGKSKLIIIAGDISQNGRKSVTDACNYRNVKFIEYSDKENLGKITGAPERAVISVNDRGFAEAIFKKYTEVISGRNE